MLIETLNIAPSTVYMADGATVFDIATLLNAVYQQNIEPTQGGRIPKRITKKLEPQLKGNPRYAYDNTNQYIDMLFLAMQNLRIIQISKPPFPDMKARIEPGPSLAFWSRMNLAEQTKLLLELWKSSSHWVDIPGANFDTWSTSSYYINTKAGRENLLDILSRYNAGQWYPITGLLDLLFEEKPLALRRIYGSIGREELQKLKEQRQTWTEYDGEIYTGMLATSLYEFGIINFGFNNTLVDAEEINPDAFMLTEQGAQLLTTQNESHETTPSPQQTTRLLIVQPSFEILLLQPDLPTLYSILPFAQANQIGIASSFKLTSASLLRGIAGGYKIEQIIETLTTRSQKELPQNVVYTLYDWAKQYKEARVSSTLLIEVPDTEIGNQLCKNPKLQQYLIREITPGLLAVNSDLNLQDLRNTLDKLGIAIQFVGNFPSKATGRQDSNDY